MLARRLAALAAALLPAAGVPAGELQPGDPVPDEELPTLDGGKAPLLSKKALANVFVFVRPGQEASLDTLRQMAGCEKDLAGKPVYWVAVVSGGVPAEAVRGMVRDAGVRMPVLVDRGDALYSRLGVRTHPLVGLADARHRLAAWHPYTRLNYCEAIKARIRFLLGEIDEAALRKVLEPPVATMPGADASKVGMRDVNLGRRQLQQRLYDKALSSARKALERDPGLAAAHALVGEVLAAQGDCPAALEAFAEALELDPGDAHALAGKKACGG
ncbi:MAG TPA: tetratricopeptide repeat protein [Anaeromyxobacteraceae bacterium]|nr:tetratricopeptide repeat protein [Anaeromyxobacteraceae bacterium]